ncbi:MAG: hypothetical protein ACOX3U_00130 [Christensenellales bacterium]|jgi:hypothetical protein
MTTSNLYLGMFDFLEVFIKPLWGVVILVFIAILVVLSRTIILEAKKRQKGIKPAKTRSDFTREIEPYSEIPYVRITFDGREPEYRKRIDSEE